MTATITAPTPGSPSASMDSATAFAAIALAAVSWDGVLSMAGSRALRHALDYRHPYHDFGDERMVGLMNELLLQLRRQGAQHLMVEAAAALNPSQRATAYAMAAEIMRSDGPLQDDETNILTNLAITLELEEELTDRVRSVMDLLHADVVLNG
ncbi:MAG: tellurite resistance TerB family protein [Synechococcaceae cyanobacterium]|nr:tellurite resistance TerB family protein [Synechococcaceae cyanobacterium]